MNRKTKKKPSSKDPHLKSATGFTLVELLVVISIIALLISIVVPALGTAKSRGQTIRCAANLKQIGTAVGSYVLDYETYPVGLQGNSMANRINWASEILSYLEGGSNILSEQTEASMQVFQCPSAAIRGGDNHYAAHPVIHPHLTSGGSYSLYSDGKMERPTEVVLIMDASQRSYGASDAQIFNVLTAYQTYDSSANDNNDPVDAGPNTDGDGTSRGHIRWRHGADNQANFVFADGHVMTLPIGQLFKKNLRAD